MSSLKKAVNTGAEDKFINGLREKIKKEFDKKYHLSWSYGYQGHNPNPLEEPDWVYAEDHEDSTDIILDDLDIKLRYEGQVPYFYVSLSFTESSPYRKLAAQRNIKAYDDYDDYDDRDYDPGPSEPDWNDSDEKVSELKDELFQKLQDMFANDRVLKISEENEGDTDGFSFSFGITLRGRAGMFVPDDIMDVPDLRMRREDPRILSDMTDKLGALLQRNHAWGTVQSGGYSDPENLTVDVYDPVFTVEVKPQRAGAVRIYSGLMDFVSWPEDKGGSVLATKSGGKLQSFPSNVVSERQWVTHLRKTVIPVIRRAFPDLELKDFKVAGFRLTFTLVGETKFKDVPQDRRQFRLASDLAWKA